MTTARTKAPTAPSEPDPGGRPDQILDVAARLFATRGYGGTSMRDIAEACGISKSLLYHHFESKDAIYTHITVTGSQGLYAFVDGRVMAEETPSARIRAFMLATAEYFDRNRWAWIAATNAFWSDPTQRRHGQRLARRDRYEQQLRALIRDAIAAGEMREVDVAMAGRLILSSINWMHRWYDPAGPSTPAELSVTFFDLIVDGLRNPEDRGDTAPLSHG